MTLLARPAGQGETVLLCSDRLLWLAVAAGLASPSAGRSRFPTSCGPAERALNFHRRPRGDAAPRFCVRERGRDVSVQVTTEVGLPPIEGSAEVETRAIVIAIHPPQARHGAWLLALVNWLSRRVETFCWATPVTVELGFSLHHGPIVAQRFKPVALAIGEARGITVNLPVKGTWPAEDPAVRRVARGLDRAMWRDELFVALDRQPTPEIVL